MIPSPAPWLWAPGKGTQCLPAILELGLVPPGRAFEQTREAVLKAIELKRGITRWAFGLRGVFGEGGVVFLRVYQGLRFLQQRVAQEQNGADSLGAGTA